MADNTDVLSAKLEVKDAFTSQMDNFVKSVLSAENAFNNLVSKLESSSSKLESTLEGISKRMEEVSNVIISQNDKIASSVINSSNKIEQAQIKTIDGISKRYTQMGENVQGVFKDITKDAENIAKSGVKININGGNSNNNNHNHSSSSSGNTDYALTSLLSGDFSMMLMNLGVIGAGVLGASKILSTIENWAQQGFNAINTLSGNLLSYDGLKEGLEEASQFQTNRIALDTLYDNNPAIGQKYYQIGTYLAKETPYSEIEVGALQKKLAGAHVNYDSNQLMTLLDVASIKPELGAEHVGFSLVDSMAGRSTSLKTNYMLDNKEINKYLQSLRKTNPTDYRQWKDAFNKTGTVNNKQEYFDLLIDYVQKQTSYNGLTEKYSHTISGMIDRLQGNWETLKADLLGIDANNTGMAKTGKVTVVSAFNDFMTNLNDWLDNSNTKVMLQDFGDGLGSAVSSIGDALSDFLKKVDWKEVGKTLKEMGDSIADFIKKLTSSPEFTSFINNLPNILDKVLKDQEIKWKTNAKTDVDLAQGKWGQYAKDWTQGKSDQVSNLFGMPTSDDWKNVPNPYASNSNSNTGIPSLTSSNNYATANSGTNIITDYNASTYLAQNPNLSDDQREKIQDYMKKDNVGVYNNISIAQINANDFDEILASIQAAQNNSK